MKPYIITGVCLMLLSGCRKDGTPIPVDIKFIDYYSSQPISGLKVCLSEHKTWDLFGGTHAIDTLTTGSNGKVSYSLTSSQDYIYYLTPSKDTNYCRFDNIDLSNSGATNSQTIKLKKYNFLKINLIDTSNIYQTFSIGFTGNYTYGSNYYGNFKDTSIILSRCVPDGFADILIELKPANYIGSKNIMHDSSIYVTHVDTFQVNMKY